MHPTIEVGVIPAVAGLFFLWAGIFFCVIGIIGLMRFPDVYTRIHASGKVSTVGLIGILIGVAILYPPITLKAVALTFFVLLTSPIASHAIASAAYRQRVPMVTGKAGEATPSPTLPPLR